MNATDNKLSINFGALSDTIAKQLRKQGFDFHTNTVAHFQKQSESILILRMGNILPDSAVDKAYSNLHKKIVKHVKQFN